MGTAIVIGVGPDQGLGAQLCKRFAAEDLKVIVAGRTQSALQAVVADIEKTGDTAVPFVADATKESDIAALFDAAGETLDLAVYNAGNNTPGKIIEMEADYFETAWRVVCFGGFLFGREAVRRMAPKKAGTLLFTGASASLRGRSGYGAFNSAKAGLRTLAQAMAKEYAPDGIHVAHVVVDGAIDTEWIKANFPERYNAGPDAIVDPDDIAEIYWQLHRQKRSAWTFEMDLRPWQETWWCRGRGSVAGCRRSTHAGADRGADQGARQDADRRQRADDRA